ncbi:hypothetical protein RBE51_18770 [Pseudomonas taiwanensis]|uniref:hypothetical protein n=1 Tax=Pseudomonas taiwanensis TaxID=470150 RepID=UPI0028DECFBD|nr:hypothetical protein [Pseudomonas taiwanensis]MDT8924838.1 hypothetical protein [Pseudomonas taiwanensis]
MSHLKQFSYIIKDTDFKKGPHVSVVEIQSHPFQHPKELIGFVNQNGVLKLHGIIDENQPKVINEFVLVGTGATIPDDMIERLYRIDSVLIGDGQYGYHAYILLDPRGIPEAGSDVGLIPKFKLSITYSASASELDKVELDDFFTDFCDQHKGVVRYHPEEGDVDQVEIHGYTDSFRQDQAFHNFMGQLYKSSVIDDVNLTKAV